MSLFVLSYVKLPRDGARYGKATVNEPEPLTEVFDQVQKVHTEFFGKMPATRVTGSVAYRLAHSTGTDVHDPATGITFRLDHADRAPNVCPCCGRLVKFGDHAFAGTDDAYCDGCYLWGEKKIECHPDNTAHANPWGTDAKNARWVIEIVFESAEGETSHDVRYSSQQEDPTETWPDDVDNALIAWPGLRADQIISAHFGAIEEV